MSKLTCADVELEALYIRSCYGPTKSRQYTHLADDQLRLAPSDCAFDAHGAILQAFCDIVDGKRRIEPSEMRAALLANPRGGQLAVEKFEALTGFDGAPEEQPAPLAAKLRMLARRRRKWEALQRACVSLAAGHEDAADEHLLSVSSEGTEKRDGEYMSLHESIVEALTEARRARKDSESLRTGFPHVDHALGALRPKTMTVIGGTTGSGKSSVILAMAMSQARRGIRVGIVSCEDSETVWGERGVAHMSGVNPDSLHIDNIHVNGRIEKASIESMRLPVHFAYELNRPLNDVLRAVRHLVRKHGCQVIYVDYLQAIADSQGKERRHFVSNAASRIKAQCQELGVALVLASQLSRPSKEKPFGEVFTSDLKESGDIENMSEVVMLLWRDGDSDKSQTLGKVAKVKWSARRPRFVVQRDGSGSVVGMVERAAEDMPSALPDLRRMGL